MNLGPSTAAAEADHGIKPFGCVILYKTDDKLKWHKNENAENIMEIM